MAILSDFAPVIILYALEIERGPMPTVYWTKETDDGWTAITEDGIIFLVGGDILCHPQFNDFIIDFNAHRKKGDRLFPGPPPPPKPGDDADTDELERWMEDLGESFVSNSIDDSESH